MADLWDNGKQAKWCTFLNAYHISGAVLDVYRENERRERDGSCKIKANSDDWGLVDTLRADIHRRAKTFWYRRVPDKNHPFPFSVDLVVDIYFRYRKRPEAELAELEAEIGQFSLSGSV